MREFHSLKMELGKDPKKITMRVDRVPKELWQVEKAVDEDDKKSRDSEQTHGRVCQRTASAGRRGR